MIATFDIPQGYKSSPLGIIPKDWEVKRLGEIGIFVKGYGVPKDHIKKDGYPCLTYGDLYTKYDVVIKNIQSFIDDEDAATSQKIYDGDILFAGSGETPEDIGKCAAYIDKQIAYAGGDIIILRPTMPYNNLVLSYILNSDIGGKQRYQMAQGHSVVHIYPCNLEKISIPLPPLAEQERIAELLGTWDKAIEMQKQLIEKLELRKKGLMQQLLTGKKRMPGFTGEWKEIVLKDISNITIGEFVHKKFQNPNGKYPVYNGGITETGYYDYSNQKGGQIVISARGAGGGFINKVDCDYWAGNSSYSVDVNNAHFDWIYVYLYMKSKQSILDGNKQQGGGVPSVNKSQVENFIIKYPPTKEEQSAIAHVFSALDYEIQKLTEKRDKYIEEKQGLMQVLLTGKKRI